MAVSDRLQPSASNCWALAVTSGLITEAPRVRRDAKKNLGAARPKRLERAIETAFRDAQSLHDVDLTTCVLINQLGCI